MNRKESIERKIARLWEEVTQAEQSGREDVERELRDEAMNLVEMWKTL